MFKPTHIERWAMPRHYIGEHWAEYYSAGVGQSRDSDALDRSDSVIVVRESHWAVGWIEWIAIHESDKTALKIADETKARLADYPIINEDDLSEREQDDANETWRNCYSPTERIAYIREHRYQFEFTSFADMMGCVRGTYFAGYANELIY